MMIKILCVGKIKEKYLELAIKEYQKRMTKYFKIQIIETPDYNFDINKTKKEEGKNLLNKISDKDYVIAMDIDGVELSSLSFAKLIDKNLKDDIVFVIGGSYGLSDEVKKRANYLMSFSKLTYPHQLFRVILLEQIYRSFKINNNETYHK
ncbi:MAG: 23S rRNA (pseudouridine(1915)-N(3))-methyltransferase RlmH [Bacilli bacterium]